MMTSNCTPDESKCEPAHKRKLFMTSLANKWKTIGTNNKAQKKSKTVSSATKNLTGQQRGETSNPELLLDPGARALCRRVYCWMRSVELSQNVGGASGRHPIPEYTDEDYRIDVAPDVRTVVNDTTPLLMPNTSSTSSLADPQQFVVTTRLTTEEVLMKQQQLMSVRVIVDAASLLKQIEAVIERGKGSRSAVVGASAQLATSWTTIAAPTVSLIEATAENGGDGCRNNCTTTHDARNIHDTDDKNIFNKVHHDDEEEVQLPNIPMCVQLQNE
eukprot:PhM_4_TR8290/c2_g1_i3/m.40600